MGVIKLLDKHTAELIAAGEVIERPSSAIKELVENAIDSGADQITVEIQHGGITFMRVTDDGCGIDRDDIQVAFLRHATSKIREKDDLDCIATLGFRGEALASIAAVSKVEVLTCKEDSIAGTRYEINGGDEVLIDDAGCPNGTTFIVRDLFYNVPARMKFLKKDVSEANSISGVMDRIALSHPEISFTFIRDGKQVLKTSGDGNLKNAIFSVFGKDFTNSLIPVDYSHEGIHVHGYISKPVSARPNRSMQLFFINGRYIKTRTAMAAIEEAYKGSIMVGKFPACVLSLDMRCDSLDVNVHPAKLEVRFTNERPVFDAVYHAVKSSLLSGDKRGAFEESISRLKPETLSRPEPKTTQISFSYSSNGVPPQNGVQAVSTNRSDDEPQVFMPPVAVYKPLNVADSTPSFYRKTDSAANQSIQAVTVESSKLFDNQSDKQYEPYSKDDIQSGEPPQKDEKNIEVEPSTEKVEPVRIEAEQAKEESDEQQCQNESSSLTDVDDKIFDKAGNTQIFTEQQQDELKLVGEAFSTYIILEYNKDSLMFIDKHAAHERLLYEKFKSERSEQFSQLLLEPVTVALDKNEYDAVISNLDVLQNVGFDVDDFGNGSVIVRSAPQLIEHLDIADTIMEMAGYLLKNKRDILTEKMEWLYRNMACRAAIKAGNKSHPQELVDLALRLKNNPQIRYCPHGRPIYFVMSKYELEKRFCRV